MASALVHGQMSGKNWEVILERSLKERELFQPVTKLATRIAIVLVLLAFTQLLGAGFASQKDHKTRDSRSSSNLSTALNHYDYAYSHFKITLPADWKVRNDPISPPVAAPKNCPA
jgi:hypothetical protein